MSESVFEDIKITINNISLLKERQKEFLKELEYFKAAWPKVSEDTATMSAELHLSGLRRLGHEVMFLTIETYSLHLGISKQKSLFSKAFKEKPKILTKVDKSNSFDRTGFRDLGIHDSNGRRNHTEEEIIYALREANKEFLKARKSIKANSGITSTKHSEIDKWSNSVLEENDIEQLDNYRNEFAHRLDSLEKIRKGISLITESEIEKILNLVSKILDSYQKILNELLIYTRSKGYGGLVSEHDSLSRLELFELNKDKLLK